MGLRTEFFRLPHGYRDAAGRLHRDGVMREVTAADLGAAAADPTAPHEAARMVVLLARVLLRVGTVEAITPALVERLPTGDFLFLQQLYRRLNRRPGWAGLAHSGPPEAA